MADEDLSLSWGAILSVMPDWLSGNIQNLNGFIQNPVRWVNKRIVQFLLGMIGAAVFGIADYIQLIWETVTGAFVSAGAPIAPILSRAGTNVFVLLLDVHDIIRGTMAFAGPFAPILVMGAYAVLFTLVFMALRAAAPAVTDLLGSIPVVGSLLDAILTFGIEFTDRLAAFVGGGDGG